MLAIVLIPSAALFITGASVAGYLISDGFSARDFANYFARISGPIVQVTTAIEQERTISLRALGGDRQSLAGLPAVWATTNAALSEILRAGVAGQSINPQEVAGAEAAAHALTEQLAVVRQGVQTGRASVSEVDAFYTQRYGKVVQLVAEVTSFRCWDIDLIN